LGGGCPRPLTCGVFLHRGGGEKGDCMDTPSSFNPSPRCRRVAAVRGDAACNRSGSNSSFPHIEVQAQGGGRACCKAASTPSTLTIEPMNMPHMRYNLCSRSPGRPGCPRRTERSLEGHPVVLLCTRARAFHRLQRSWNVQQNVPTPDWLQPAPA